jgi:hypothetical protein
LNACAAPSLTHAAHLASLPAVASTVAPKATPSMIAVEPRPLVPPCTRKVSPAFSRARVKKLSHAVNMFSGKVAASCALQLSGIGSTCCIGATAYSA